MATLGHVAVGMAAARITLPGDSSRARLGLAMALLSLLALAPDADVIAFFFRIPYDSTWGHRGAVHSLGFAALVALAVAIAARAARLPPARTGLTVGLVLASHGLLDTLTDGGMGIALLWPLSDQRFFAPWQPLPVAPIGRRFVTLRGLAILATEAAFFAPVLLVALWPRRWLPARWRREPQREYS